VQHVDESIPKSAKYQYGEGRLSDQLLGQWFAEVVHLGKLLPHEHIRSALGSIFRYNYREGFEDFPNAQRLYALNDDKGLLLCSWPKGKRPALPFVYSDEVVVGDRNTGGGTPDLRGMVKEGIAIGAAVRDRHDGISGIRGMSSGGHHMRGRWRAGPCSPRSAVPLLRRRGRAGLSASVASECLPVPVLRGLGMGQLQPAGTPGSLENADPGRGRKLEIARFRVPYSGTGAGDRSFERPRR
jgi:hypothetical protein